MQKLIDLSQHNGSVDFTKVKAAGITGVILRTGYGKNIANQRDKKFEEYYTGAKSAGLAVGAYHYSYAVTPEAAEQEADFMLEIIKGKQFEYPIYFDIEEKSQVALPKSVCTAIVQAFCNKLEAAGYWAGVYSFDSFFGSNLDPSIQGRYTCWVARVEDVKPVFCRSYSMWQYSWEGNVSGINGDVDLNYCYKDFPSMIKAKGLNGFADTYRITAVKDKLTKAEAVVRKARLEAEGYTVEII